ncbi:MAG TPA: EutN/CcmL family microcompartment protein [bacterium]|nr:EutN/CcmL family microcompartment protein [bacterium]
MDIMTVIGTVVASQKVPQLQGYKLLLVADAEERDARAAATVAIDTVGAGEGERVIVVRGSSARAAAGLAEAPVDAVIVGIVDQVDRDGQVIFRK